MTPTRREIMKMAEEETGRSPSVPSWARDPWNDGTYCSCPICGAFHELVRPGKHQPTCDCHRVCPEHGVLDEYRACPSGHVGGGVVGWVCPKCWPACECEACRAQTTEIKP